MRRRTSFVMLFLLCLAVIFFFYINNIFIPIKLKQFVVNKSEEFLHREVTLGKISFSFLKGFTISDFRIYRKSDPQKIFINISEASFNIFYLPFQKRKKLIISGLNIKEPLIYLLLNSKNDWNFSDILQKSSNTKGEGRYGLYITQLKVDDGNLIFLNDSQKEPYTEQFSNLKIAASILHNKQLQFFVGSQIPRKKSYVTFKGAYSIIDKKLKAHISSNNLYVSEYLNLLIKNPGFKLTNGILSFIEGDISYSRKNNSVKFLGDYALRDVEFISPNKLDIKGKINGERTAIAYNGKKILMKGNITLSSADIKTAKDKEFQGNISLRIDMLNYDFNKLTTSGAINVDSGVLFLDPKNIYKSGLTAPDVKLRIQGKEISLFCDLKTTNTNFTINKDISFNGNLSANNMSLSFKDNEFGIKGVVSAKKTTIKLDDARSFNGDILASEVNLSSKKDILSLTAKAEIKNAYINVDNNIKFQGDPSIILSYKHFNGKNIANNKYSGSISFQNSTLLGTKYFEKLTNISGTLKVKNDSINTDELNFTADGTLLRVTGTLSNFKNPFADINIKSASIDLSKVYLLFKEQLRNLTLKISGNASADIGYKGLLSAPKESDIIVDAELTDTNISLEKKKIDVSGISGNVKYKKDLLIFKNIQGLFKKNLYKLNGKLSDFSRPILDANILSQDLSASIQVKILNNAFGFTKLSGEYMNSSFDLKGDVRTFQEEEPDFDIRGSMNLFIEDFYSLNNGSLDKIRSFGPKGYLAFQNFLFKGKTNDWRNWQLTFMAQMPSLTLKGYPFKNIVINYSQRDKNVSKCEASSLFYNGELKISSTADLTKEDIPMNTNLSLINLDLAEMRKDKKIKQPDIRGTLSVNATIKGPLTNPDKFTGNGSFLTNKAYLGEIKIIKGLTSTINNIPGYIGNLVASLTNEATNLASSQTTNYISDVKGDFIIKDKRLYTENTLILGSIYDLIITGNVGFNKNLDLIVFPDYIRFQNKEKKATEFIGTPVQIKITGSLDNPKYKPLINPVKPIEKAVGTTINLLKEVGDIFGDMIK